VAARRWDAWFEEEHLVVRRRRLLPWLKADARRIPLAAILDNGSLTAADRAKRRARLSVQEPSAPHLTEIIPVRFTPEQWEHAGWLMRERQVAPTEPSQPGEETASEGALPRPTRLPTSRHNRRDGSPPAALAKPSLGQADLVDAAVQTNCRVDGPGDAGRRRQAAGVAVAPERDDPPLSRPGEQRLAAKG
jgi:hypothetical protein